MRIRTLVLLIGIAVVGMGSVRADAQIRPLRTYNGIELPLRVLVDHPDAAAPSSPTTADLWIDLIEPVSGNVVARARTEPGEERLDRVFPLLWTRAPKDAHLLYAQLRDGDQRIGPALVLQPMVTPSEAVGDGRGGAGGVRFIDPSPERMTFTGIRAYVDQLVRLETTAGVIELRLRPDEAPNTVWHFRELVGGGFYRDMPFHRIVRANPSGAGFVIQSGDPSGTGTGGAGFFMDLEPSALKHDFGVVSMARTREANTNSSQFFICLSRKGTRALDGQYTSFAEAVSGAEAIVAISDVPVRPDNRPVEPSPRIIQAMLVDAPPRGLGAAPVVDPRYSPIRR